jgi:hypothetical protein
MTLTAPLNRREWLWQLGGGGASKRGEAIQI